MHAPPGGKLARDDLVMMRWSSRESLKDNLSCRCKVASGAPASGAPASGAPASEAPVLVAGLMAG